MFIGSRFQNDLGVGECIGSKTELENLGHNRRAPELSGEMMPSQKCQEWGHRGWSFQGGIRRGEGEGRIPEPMKGEGRAASYSSCACNKRSHVTSASISYELIFLPHWITQGWPGVSSVLGPHLLLPFSFQRNRTQVWLSAASKATTWGADAHVKESGFILVLATWKMRGFRLKAQLSISGVLASLYGVGGTMGRGDRRNFWQCEFSQLRSWMVSVLSRAFLIVQFLPSVCGSLPTPGRRTWRQRCCRFCTSRWRLPTFLWSGPFLG